MSKNGIGTLAVSNDTEKLSFAYFDGDILEDYGRIETKNLGDMHKILHDFARESRLSFIVVHALDFENCKRRTALLLTRTRTVLKLISEQLGIVYATPSTNGWEKYYFGDRVQGKKLWEEKVKVVNEVYGLDLVYDDKLIDKQDQFIADAIVLGSAFTQDALKKYKEGYYGL